MLLSAQSAQSVATSASIFPSGIESPVDLCIICDGDVSLGAASILTAGGHSVRLWASQDRSITLPQYINKLPLEFEVRERGAAVSSVRGKTGFGIVSEDLKVAIKGSDGVIVSRPITEYGALAQQLAAYLTNGQTVCLFNAPLGAGLQFKEAMRKQKKDLQLNIVEMGPLFDCAKVEGNVLLIIGPREKVSVSGNTRNETRRGLQIINSMSKGLVPASNVLERGLSEVESILRPVFLLFALLGGRYNELDRISNLVNPSLTRVIRCLDTEIQSIAKAYRCQVASFLETLTHFGGVGWEEADCLDQALISIGQNLLGQSVADQGELTVDAATELLKTDIITTISLLCDFARLSRTPVPVLNSLVELSSVVTRADLQKLGRKVSDLGLVGFDLDEVKELINA